MFAHMIVSKANLEKVEVGVGWRWEIVECIAWTRHIISSYLSFLISTSFCLLRYNHHHCSYTQFLLEFGIFSNIFSVKGFMDSSGWLDNNYQILMVTFSNWLTGDALLWFIEFLFEITSSDQLTHITQLFTRLLISYPFLKVAHNTKEYAALK